jgi:hypothetical protein
MMDIAVDVPDVAVLQVKPVLVPPPGAIGAVAGSGFHVERVNVPQLALLSEAVSFASAMEPELVTVIVPYPAPEPLGTAKLALTWIWLVFCALDAVVVK